MVPISVGEVHTKLALTLNGAPANGWWDWSPRISRSLDRIPSFQKKKAEG